MTGARERSIAERFWLLREEEEMSAQEKKMQMQL
jgi:hypothetical protein